MTLKRSILILGLVLPAAAAAQTPAPYRPGLGDLMTMTVQPRHLKVGIAGQEKNWPYAAYEGHELEEAFERIAKLVPKWREFDIPQLLAAAKAGNGQRFDAAYRQLTDACNACHKSANVGVIAIKVPDASAFPNQDFRAAKP